MKLDSSARMYPSSYFVVLLTGTTCKSLSDGLCFRTAGLIRPNCEKYRLFSMCVFTLFCLGLAHVDQVLSLMLLCAVACEIFDKLHETRLAVCTYPAVYFVVLLNTRTKSIYYD